MATFFALYILFVVVPDAEIADFEMERMAQQDTSMDTEMSIYQTPEYQAAFSVSEKRVEYSTYLLFGAILSFLLCIYPAFKKNLLAIIGVVLSLGAFFVAAAYGTHMFS